jgi:hypothetical protein
VVVVVGGGGEVVFPFPSFFQLQKKGTVVRGKKTSKIFTQKTPLFPSLFPLSTIASLFFVVSTVCCSLYGRSRSKSLNGALKVNHFVIFFKNILFEFISHHIVSLY